MTKRPGAISDNAFVKINQNQNRIEKKKIL
jgi:hypothetical protein